MILVKPKVEYWSENEDLIFDVSHIAKCARLSHMSTGTNDRRLIDFLIKQKHLSTFRHGSSYYIIPERSAIKDADLLYFCRTIPTHSPYVHCVYDEEKQLYFLSTNVQYVIEHSKLDAKINNYAVTLSELKRYGNIVEPIIRHTFCITTQISTTRELNRVSPNNIIEESTRYCNYSKDKFGKDVKICIPYWFDIDFKDGESRIYDDILRNEILSNPNYSSFNNVENTDITLYLHSLEYACDNYIDLINNGLTTDMARGVLPLDTASTVAYTYTTMEWAHIINLRYFGTTGAPHPNAKKVISMVRNIFNKDIININKYCEQLKNK